ncbi:MAG TPA: carboxyltransferase domain-containing protein [Actinocrinis sp.]|jgi:KipI family sensor histidine kinase inhibitor
MDAQILRYGERALLVDCGSRELTAALYAELVRRRDERALPPVDDLVPAERSILIDGLDDPAGLAAQLASWDVWVETGAGRAQAEPETDVVHIAVDYNGPDLESVAEAWGVPARSVGALHSAHEYRSAFCGFAPGFAYLTGLPEQYRLPRRPTPRPSVPPGSVAVAGPYTGVYPSSSPGGWHLIGTTDARLWDLTRPQPALLPPGTRVRFAPREAST